MATRLNLQTASREEIVDLVRRQNAKLKELNTAQLMLKERDERLAALDTTLKLVKDELADEKTSRKQDSNALQTQLQALSHQLVEKEEELAAAAVQATALRQDVEAARQREQEAVSSQNLSVIGTVDAVVQQRLARLEDQLRRAKVKLREVADGSACSSGSSAVRPRHPLASYDVDRADTAQELASVTARCSELQADLSKLQEERAALAVRCVALEQQVAQEEWGTVSGALQAVGRGTETSDSLHGLIDGSRRTLQRPVTGLPVATVAGPTTARRAVFRSSSSSSSGGSSSSDGEAACPTARRTTAVRLVDVAESHPQAAEHHRRNGHSAATGANRPAAMRTRIVALEEALRARDAAETARLFEEEAARAERQQRLHELSRQNAELSARVVELEQQQQRRPSQHQQALRDVAVQRSPSPQHGQTKHGPAVVTPRYLAEQHASLAELRRSYDALKARVANLHDDDVL